MKKKVLQKIFQISKRTQRILYAFKPPLSQISIQTHEIVKVSKKTKEKLFKAGI